MSILLKIVSQLFFWYFFEVSLNSKNDPFLVK